MTLLLDELDKTATIITSSDEGRGSTFVDRLGTLNGEHWSSLFLTRVSDHSFMQVMAACGVHQYLRKRLRRSYLKKETNDRKCNSKPNNRTPLIIAALW